MKVFVSAGEISSDLQAEKILLEFIKLYPHEKIEIAGIGGPRLRALPHFQTVERAENLRVMGFTEVLLRIFFIRRVLKKTVQFLKQYQPDILITFDYPDFHFSLMKSVGKIEGLKNTIKICGIPPKVWVWRTKRIERIKTLYDAVWVIFPFEEKLYRGHGIPVFYAGNPLISDVLKRTRLIEKDSWLKNEVIQLAVFPGSRDAELKYHVPIIQPILERVSDLTQKKILAQVPVPTGVSLETLRSKLVSSEKIQYQFVAEGSAEVLARNGLGLIKSGTSTLEAAVLGCVPVIYYKVSPITEWLFRRFVRYAGPVGLPNILLGNKGRTNLTFPEYIGADASIEAVSQELVSLIKDPERLFRLQEKGRQLRVNLSPVESVAEAVAKKIFQWIHRPIGMRVKREARTWKRVASFLWSTINSARRILHSCPFLKPKLIPCRSVLVGNLQAGGAGKTPLVIAIAKEAVRRGFTVGVISRGYGGSQKESLLYVDPKGENANLVKNASVIGDEPVEILSEVPQVVMGLSADRNKMAESLIKKGINFLVFDDGFQNLKFKTQFTVLALTDAKRSEVIYRDFDSASKDADVLVLTKGRPSNTPDRAEQIEWEVDALPEKPIWLLCALGDPAEVVQFYRNEGVKIFRVITKADHSDWKIAEIAKLQREAETENALLAMTPKDAMKIESVNFPSIFILRRKIKNLDWLEPLFTK